MPGIVDFTPLAAPAPDEAPEEPPLLPVCMAEPDDVLPDPPVPLVVLVPESDNAPAPAAEGVPLVIDEPDLVLAVPPDEPALVEPELGVRPEVPSVAGIPDEPPPHAEAKTRASVAGAQMETKAFILVRGAKPGMRSQFPAETVLDGPIRDEFVIDVVPAPTHEPWASRA
jgi:hypothetical protein